MGARSRANRYGSCQTLPARFNRLAVHCLEARQGRSKISTASKIFLDISNVHLHGVEGRLGIPPFNCHKDCLMMA
jgi:hypothetical protein